MPGIHVRKGLPWSFELGGTLNYLIQSDLFGLGGEVKWSIFEGYRHGFRGALPDVAARGSVVRVIGETDVDLTIVGVDGSISYAFGIGGMVTLTPYAGFQYLWSFVRIEPLVYRDDATGEFHQPESDTQGGNVRWDMTGLTGPDLGRMKLFGGFRFGYEMLAITVELGWGLSGKWNTDAVDTPQSIARVGAQSKAEVGNQIQVSAGAGMDF